MRSASGPFCILMRKPIDKIMICYAKVPTDFTSSFESYFSCNHSLTQSSSNNSTKATAAAQASADTLATLGRHMHHKRWLWVTRDVVKDERLLSSVLSALTAYVALCLLTQCPDLRIAVIFSKRLSEGFHFAYNLTGMINMVLEIEMAVDGGSLVPCVMQYILFPPQNGPSAGKE